MKFLKGLAVSLLIAAACSSASAQSASDSFYPEGKNAAGKSTRAATLYSSMASDAEVATAIQVAVDGLSIDSAHITDETITDIDVAPDAFLNPAKFNAGTWTLPNVLDHLSIAGTSQDFTYTDGVNRASLFDLYPVEYHQTYHNTFPSVDVTETNHQSYFRGYDSRDGIKEVEFKSSPAVLEFYDTADNTTYRTRIAKDSVTVIDSDNNSSTVGAGRITVGSNSYNNLINWNFGYLGVDDSRSMAVLSSTNDGIPVQIQTGTDSGDAYLKLYNSSYPRLATNAHLEVEGQSTFSNGLIVSNGITVPTGEVYIGWGSFDAVIADLQVKGPSLHYDDTHMIRGYMGGAVVGCNRVDHYGRGQIHFADALFIQGPYNSSTDGMTYGYSDTAIFSGSEGNGIGSLVIDANNGQSYSGLPAIVRIKSRELEATSDIATSTTVRVEGLSASSLVWTDSVKRLTSTAASQTANTFYAAPNGSSGSPTFRVMNTTDLPSSIPDSKLATISTAGKVSDSALSSNIPLKNASNTFTNGQIFQTSGSNAAAFLQLKGTGNANNYTRWYSPIASGSTAQTDYYGVISTANGGGDWFGSSTTADATTRFYGSGGFKHNISIDGRLKMTGTTPATSGAYIQTPSVALGNATGSTDGHFYVQTSSGSTINALDLNTDANFIYFNATNASATNNIFYFQSASGKTGEMRVTGNSSSGLLRVQGNGADQGSSLFIQPTGTGVGAFRFYFPTTTGSSGGSEYTEFSANATTFDVNLFGTATRNYRVYNSDGTAVANMSLEGRLGCGTSTPPTSGAYVQAPSVNINAGTDIIGHLSATGSVDFASMAAGGTDTKTLTVTGAATGDTVVLGPPANTDTAGMTWSAYVSVSNTVTIRVHNESGGVLDPASATWRADVWKH
jgi:hypothetical protein